jgi:hypothetical protein
MTGYLEGLGEEGLGGGKAATKPLPNNVTVGHFDRREKSHYCLV